MNKALFIADLHIKLGQRNVPRDWQGERFMQLARELNEVDADYIIIAGDLLDVAKPSVDEIGLMYNFLNLLEGEKILIPGNHEMTTKKKDCYIPIEHMLSHLGCSVIREFTTHRGFDYIPYNILHNKWPEPQSKLAVTHVRGEIPPHVEPEIDLRKYEKYEKVFAGDLHSYKNTQKNIYYPGSPFTTSFHRTEASGSNGYFIIDSDSGEHVWHELHLPQLLRRTVTDPEEMVATYPNHTIYELEGELDDLAKVGKLELLDKKITKNVENVATLNLNGKIEDELAVYLEEVKELTKQSVTRLVSRFKEVHTHDSD